MGARQRRWSLLLVGAAMLAGLSCGRSTSGRGGEPATAAPPATPTSVPTPPPPINTPAALPADSELRALIEYANAMQPLLVEGGAIVERDGEILKAAEGGNTEVLCDGRLEADNQDMKRIVSSTRAIQPPRDAQAIHDLVLRSGDAWTEALDSVEKFCETGNALHIVPAGFKFWEAALAIQDAGNRFWMLVVSEGVQDWVRR